jgi:pyridoxal biosynthesis lyase PdxS
VGLTAYAGTLLVLHAVPGDLRAALGGLARLARPRGAT